MALGMGGCMLTQCTVQRESFDEELAALPIEEREAYLKEFEEGDKSGEYKKGGLIERCKCSFVFN